MTTELSAAKTDAATKLNEQEILALYDLGRYLTAYERLAPFGGLDGLVGSSGRALAGRLATNLGAERYGRSIHLRAWRKSPDAESLGFYVSMDIGRLRGPVAGLKLIDDLLSEKLSPIARADILSSKAILLSSVRDFECAEQALNEAFAVAAERPWLLVVKGQVDAAQDRRDEALAAHQESLRLQPTFRPAIQSLAENLIQLNRLDEARSLLIDALGKLESGAVLVQLAQLERELEMYESARDRLKVAESFFPLQARDRTFRKLIANLKATIAYDCGDIDTAIALSREADMPFSKATADHLSQHGRTGKRVVLDVGFTHQKADTCVPATLATITDFWRMSVAQEQIVEAICYDGTPAHAEREWLERQGFFCRDFTLTWETAQTLIDAGLPFANTLTAYRMGHMQAVIGYDSRRGVLIIRDPNYREAIECRGQELIEQMRSTGPRGMVFVPASERARVEAIDLPDHKLWEANYELTRRLDKNDRDGAMAAHEKMVHLAPEHRLTTYAQGRIASYDGDHYTLGQCTEKLLAEFPNDQNQWSVKLALLRENGTREQRLQVLGELNGKSDCETVFRQQYVEELLYDPQSRDEVSHLLRRQLRAGAIDGQTFSLMARLLWADGKRTESFEWLRFAACLDDKDEYRSTTYFHAARALNKTDEVMRMLQDRFNRFSTRSGGPGRSLAESLDQLYKPQVAVEILEKALLARPEDVGLKLYATSFLMRIGRLTDAKQHLEDCRATCRPADWQAMAARLAIEQNQLDDALVHVEQSLTAEPHNLNTQHLAADVLADLRGPTAAIEHLKKYVQRFPENQGLRALLVERASEAGPETTETEVRDFLKLHNHDAWGWRELGFSLIDQRRWQEAFATAKKAHELDPRSEATYLMLGIVYRGVGKHDKSLQALLRSVQISADYSRAISELMKLCNSLAERRKALSQVFGEMKRQVIRGDSLLLFRDYAARTFEPAEVLRMMLEANKSRTDLWQTWSAIVRQLLVMKRTDDALKYAKTAAERFPLLPQTLVDLADVQLELSLPADERSTLDRALAINSRNGQTLRRSAEAFRRAGALDEERANLERACVGEPREVTHQGALADVLWRQGDRDRAITVISAAIDREPRYEWGWQQLSEWSRVIGEPERLVKMTAKITASRPKSPQAWLQRARILAQFTKHYAESLAAIERALKLDPMLVEAYELRATILADQGQFEAALAACKAPPAALHKSTQLATRAAIIERERGDRTKAIELIRQVLEKDSRYAFAWSQLTDWLREEGKPEESLECSKKLVEVSPDYAVSWGQAAHDLLVAGEREEAIHHLQKAIDIDPTYRYGSHTLLALQIEDKKFDAALATLRLIGPHLTSEELHAKETHVNCMAGNLRAALQSFELLCRGKMDAMEHVTSAIDDLLQAGQAANARETLLRSIERTNHNPLLGRALIDIQLRAGELADAQEVLDSLNPKSATFAESAAQLAEALGDAKVAEKMSWLIANHQANLRLNTISWAAMGAALQQSGLHDDARKWMCDWRQRSDAKAHMFAPLVISSVALEETAEALEVAKVAVSLPICYATDALRVLGASAAVVEGNSVAANEWLALVRQANLPYYYANLFAVIKTACTCIAELDQGTKWKIVQPKWADILTKHVGTSADDLVQSIVSHSELMLADHQNFARKWLIQRRSRQLQRKLRRTRETRRPASLQFDGARE